MRRLIALSTAAVIGLGGVILAAGPASAACTPALPDPSTTMIEAAAGDEATFAIPGLCLGPSGSLTVTNNPASADVTWTDTAGSIPSITVTAANDTPAVAPVTLLADLGDGTQRSYYLAAYFGVSSQVVWPDAAVPAQIAIPAGGGMGEFELPGLYWPRYSECEIRVTSVPESDDFVVGPPSGSGGPIEIGLKEGTEFIGVLDVSYALACTPPGGERSGATYRILLYVGVPIPVAPQLAATGSSPATPAAPIAALLALGGLLALLQSRRTARR
ncbi:hypothetical protein [Schumannella luteola]